jgi:Protein of unknown function (DUF3375)
MSESSAAHLARLRVYFETSPAISLLRSPNAPYVVDFLHQQFKRGGRITVGLSDLLAALANYQERLHETQPDRLRDKPEVYLAQWCANETRWLHRFLEANHTEPSYELTPHTEHVLAFLERALDQDLGFVGTESRLKLIIDTLADLVVQASDDPAKRLAHLQAERECLDQEIARIEREGQVASYHPAQLRERFAIAVMLLKQLQGDFGHAAVRGCGSRSEPRLWAASCVTASSHSGEWLGHPAHFWGSVVGALWLKSCRRVLDPRLRLRAGPWRVGG